MKLTRILFNVFILLGTTSAQSGDSGIFYLTPGRQGSVSTTNLPLADL